MGFLTHDDWPPHFPKHEMFRSRGLPQVYEEDPLGHVLISEDEVRDNLLTLAWQLEIVRSHITVPIVVSSGYRPPSYNRSLKPPGAKNSQHMYGRAADLRLDWEKVNLTASAADRWSPVKLKALLEILIRDGLISPGGIGLYDEFVHYDTRGKNIRWDNRKYKIG